MGQLGGKFERNQNAGQRLKDWPVEYKSSDGCKVTFEQITLILTTYKNIDILFLMEIFLKSTSKPDWWLVQHHPPVEAPELLFASGTMSHHLQCI